MKSTTRKPTAQPKGDFSLQQTLPTFQQLLPPPVIHALALAAYGPKRFYQRLFSPLVLLWCLIFQRLNYDHTCDAVVAHVGSGSMDCLAEEHTEPLSQRLRSISTSAFCQARQKLPLAIITGALRHTVQQIHQAAGASALWLGHPVALLDGSTIALYPEGDLVQHYGQHANQRGPTYWVKMRVTVAFCLRTGVLFSAQEGSLHDSEQRLAHSVLADLPANSVCVGDQNFGVFSVVQAARHAEVNVLLRLTAKRARALAPCALSAGLDVPLVWTPSRHDQCAPQMGREPIAGRLLYFHLQRDGFRPVDLYLFTTLLDPMVYTMEALCTLYGCRWQVELDLRYVKHTLDMDLLYAKSVDIVRKELYAGFLGYNLIRGFMLQAAQRAQLTPLALSFTACWRRIYTKLTQFRPSDTRRYIQRELTALMDRLGACLLTARQPWRLEPRAVRQRPRPYPPLKGSRQAARQALLKQLMEPTKS